MPSRMTGGDRKALLNVREALSDDREWSGGPPRCPEVVMRHSLMSGSGREAFPDVREILEAPRIPGSGGEALTDVREGSGCPPGSPGVVASPSRMSSSGREALPVVREWSGGHSGCLGVVRRPCRM